MYGSPGNIGESSGGGSSDTAARSQRYNYLVGRLRGRQITMEEATELFTVMQGMVALANELARVAAYRSPAAPAPPGAGLPLPPPPRAMGVGSSADDLL
ncbi:MAG: hypothetical protein ACREDE_09190, partial [Thermoplasmata archaeon]